MKELFERCPECQCPAPGHVCVCSDFDSIEPGTSRVHMCSRYDSTRETARVQAMYKVQPDVYPKDRPRWRVWLGWQLTRLGYWLTCGMWLSLSPNMSVGKDDYITRDAKGRWISYRA